MHVKYCMSACHVGISWSSFFAVARSEREGSFNQHYLLCGWGWFTCVILVGVWAVNRLYFVNVFYNELIQSYNCSKKCTLYDLVVVLISYIAMCCLALNNQINLMIRWSGLGISAYHVIEFFDMAWIFQTFQNWNFTKRKVHTINNPQQWIIWF